MAGKKIEKEEQKMKNHSFPNSVSLSDSEYESSLSDSGVEIGKQSKNDVQTTIQVTELNNRLSLMQEKYASDVQKLSHELAEAKQLAISRKAEVNSVISKFEEQKNELEEKLRLEKREIHQLRMATQSFFTILSNKSPKQIESFDDAISFINALASECLSNEEKVNQLESQLFEASNAANSSKEQQKQIKEKAIKQVAKVQNDSESKIEGLTGLLDKENKKNKQFRKVIKAQTKKIQELQQQLDDLTSSISTQANSVSTINESNIETSVSILEAKNAMISTQLDNTNKEIRNLTIRNNELEIQNHEFSEKCQRQEKQLLVNQEEIAQLAQNCENLSNKSKALSQRNKELKETLISKETEIALLDTNLREAKIEYENLLAKQFATSLSESNSESRPNDLNQNEMYNDAISLITKLLSNQTEDLHNMQLQNKHLIDQLQSANAALGYCDKEIQKLTSENEKLLVQKLNCEKENQIEKDDEQTAFLNAVHDSLLILPREIAEEVTQYENLDYTKSQIYSKTVTKLVEYYKNLKIQKWLNESESVSKIDSQCNTQLDLMTLNASLLVHLGNANRFLKKAANVFQLKVNNQKDDEKPISSDYELISKECARISQFIDENESKIKPENYQPIFNARTFEESTKIIVQFISTSYNGTVNDFNNMDDEKLPFKELICIFETVLMMNSILNSQLNESKLTISYLNQNKEMYKRQSEQLTELDEWKRQHEKELDKIYQAISVLVNNDDSSDQIDIQNEDIPKGGLKDLVNRISNEKKQSIEERERLKQEIQNLQNQLEEAKVLHKKSNKQFCKQVDVIVENIEQNVIDRNDEYQQAIESLQSKISQLKQQKEEEIQRIELKLKKVVKKRNELNEQLIQLTAENESNQAQAKKDILALNEEIDRLNQTIVELNVANSDLQQRLNTMSSKKLIYKQKYQQASNDNQQLLKVINQRSEELAAKYDETVSRLENELTETKRKKDEAEQEIASYQSYKQNILRQNAALTLSERSLKLKLSSMADQLENEKKSYELKEKSIKMSLQNQFVRDSSNITDELMQFRVLLSNLADQYFGITMNPNTEAHQMRQMFSNAVEFKFASKEFKTVNDIWKLREALNLNESVSLSEYVKELNQKCNEKEQKLRELISTIEKLQTENDHLSSECSKTDVYKRDNNNWKEWSRAVLRQFYPSTTKELPIEVIKSHIEEILLSSISQRALFNKVDILRKEKFLLTTRNHIVVNQNPKKPVLNCKSIRPIILLIACARRIHRA